MSDPLAITCSICSDGARLHYSGDIGERMRDRFLCFNCAFWQEMIEKDAERPDEVAIIDGRHYVIFPDLPPSKPKGLAGFSGARNTITFNDGRVVISHNLWHQGEIPERWREQLPDNAVFGADQQEV